MSADLLRVRAASPVVKSWPRFNYRGTVMRSTCSEGNRCTPDAAYIASMHPVVALAVADVFDALATRAEAIADTHPSREFTERITEANVPGYSEALAAARAYLGRES